MDQQGGLYSKKQFCWKHHFQSSMVTIEMHYFREPSKSKTLKMICTVPDLWNLNVLLAFSLVDCPPFFCAGKIHQRPPGEHWIGCDRFGGSVQRTDASFDGSVSSDDEDEWPRGKQQHQFDRVDFVDDVAAKLEGCSLIFLFKSAHPESPKLAAGTLSETISPKPRLFSKETRGFDQERVIHFLSELSSVALKLLLHFRKSPRAEFHVLTILVIILIWVWGLVREDGWTSKTYKVWNRTALHNSWKGDGTTSSNHTRTHKQAQLLEHRLDQREQTFGSGNIEPTLDDMSCAI